MSLRGSILEGCILLRMNYFLTHKTPSLHSLPPYSLSCEDKKGNTVATRLFKYKNRIGYSKYEAQKL